MPVLPSYRNQSIDLLCKSIDWFLYEGNTGIYWVNYEQIHCTHLVSFVNDFDTFSSDELWSDFRKAYIYGSLVLHNKFSKIYRISMNMQQLKDGFRC